MCTHCGCSQVSDMLEEELSGEINLNKPQVSEEGGFDTRHTTCGAIDTRSLRTLELERDILEKNREYALKNRLWFSERKIFALNLLSSPGSGKTTLLIRTLEKLRSEFPLAVIEGDQQTSNDADKIKSTGVAAVQINTGSGCHLDARMVANSLPNLSVRDGGLVFIENVGNLVCPALFDIGEAHKVVILSVTEGEDKPQKYPHMFHAADLMIINKIDLLDYVDFDVAKCIAYAKKVNPYIQIIQLSASSGEGLSLWLDWLRSHCGGE